jgi:hypothetical protein
MAKPWSSPKKEIMDLRRVATGRIRPPTPVVGGRCPSAAEDRFEGFPVLGVVKVDRPGKGTGNKHGAGRTSMVTLCSKSTHYNPAYAIAAMINDAFDVNRIPAPVRTLANMTEEEKAALSAKYGSAVAK